MKRHHLSSSNAPARRAGLAPLEFTLSLPILLFVMGLMVVFGTAGAWKLRAQMNSRLAAWRAFEYRSGEVDGNPSNWSGLVVVDSRSLGDPFIDQDPLANFPVVRGPVLRPENGELSIPVNTALLDQGEGDRNGYASVTRQYPMMQPLAPGGFTLIRDHPILDGTRWQYNSMNLGSNLSRRIPVLFEFNPESQFPNLVQRYTTIARQLTFNPDEETLTPLEGGDPEIYELTGRRSPDFQPRIPLGRFLSTIDALEGRFLRPRNCESDPLVVRETYVRNLIDNIDGVPRRMRNYYINTYQSVIDNLESQDPMPPGAAATIADLERKIQQLQRFNP